MNEQIALRAKELFDSGYYCAESVLLAVAEHRGVAGDAIPGIATGLCSGIARSCGMCGAVLGAILAIGLAIGRNGPEGSVNPTYAAVNSVLEAFSACYGSMNCQELTGCDLGTDEGQALFIEKEQCDACGEYVATATRLALEAIGSQQRPA